MSKCTAAEAVVAIEYWLGYYEKASSAYASTREKSAFEKNKGNANYTYPGHLCGVQGQPWCAATVTTAIYEACGENRDEAKAVLWNIFPYVACNQVYDAAPARAKGRRGAWTPQPGDIIVFTDDGVTRTHTGMVYAVKGSYVYTIEGNSGNMCRKRSYLLTSTYIYGYVRPDYKAGAAEVTTPIEQYGTVCCNDPELHVLSKGCAGDEVKTLQRILYAKGFRADDGSEIRVDGDFGKLTQQATKRMQERLGTKQDGYVGAKTWPLMLKKLA